jgi:hypothetical protein
MIFYEKERNKYGAYEVTLRVKRPEDDSPKVLRINTEALLIPFGIEFYRDKNSGKVLDAYMQGSFSGLVFSKVHDNYIPESLEIDEANSGDVWHELKFVVDKADSKQVRQHRVWLFYRFLCLLRQCIFEKAKAMLPDDVWGEEQKKKGWFKQLGKKDMAMGITKDTFVAQKLHESLTADDQNRYPPKLKMKLSLDSDGAVETPIFNPKAKRISTAEVQKFSKVICEIVVRNIWLNPTQFGYTFRISQAMVNPPKPLPKLSTVSKEDFNKRECAIEAAFSDDDDDDGTGTVLLEQSQTTEDITEPQPKKRKTTEPSA